MTMPSAIAPAPAQPKKRTLRNPDDPPIKKRSVILRGRLTSISATDADWDYLAAIAVNLDLRRSELISDIKEKTGSGNLSAALRMLCVRHRNGRVR